MILQSCDYRNLSSNCKILNEHEIDDVVHIRLHRSMLGYKLYDILDISESRAVTVSLCGVEFDDEHPWVDIPWCNVSRVSGEHVYKLAFWDRARSRYDSVYFAYILQDDNPEKPYIYMSGRYLEYDDSKSGSYVGV